MGDAALEANIAKQLAAESIQSFMRRYLECKEQIKIRKIKSTERLVKNLAAETITKGLRSLSRSRSRLHSETSSCHHSEVQSVASKSFSSVPPVNMSDVRMRGQHSVRILRLCNLSVENVFGVVWQGKNNLFCTLRFMQWEYRTVTVPEAADSASWFNDTIDFPLPDHSRDHTKPLGSLVVCIYHENLVVSDKLIAQAEIPLISIFEGEVSSKDYICESNVDVEQIAFDGTKFKRKPKGIVKFAAQIIFAAFDPIHSQTKRIEEDVAPLHRGSLDDIKLDSTSGSLITHSINPETFREDSMYDFSAQQLRDAAHVLQEWEAPTDVSGSEMLERDTAPINANNPGSGTSRSSIHSVPRPVSRSASAKDVTQATEAKVKAPGSVNKLVSRPSVVGTINSAAPSIAAAGSSKKPSPEPLGNNTAGRTIRTEPVSGTVSSTEENPTEDSSPPTGSAKDALNRTAPAAMNRPHSAGIAGINVHRTTTRLRNRRSGTADDNAATGNDSGIEENGHKVRRSSIESASGKSGAFKKTKPATDLKSLASTDVASTSGKVTISCPQRYGNQVIDEAFRLSMKMKGAFLKLSMSELASLLDFMNFPVQKKLLEVAAPVSNLHDSDRDKQNASGNDAHQRVVQGEDVSIPIVHAMSLAATISFLVRDHQLLESHDENNRIRDEPASISVGVMNEEKSERVLAQLLGLVEGSYLNIKHNILKACGNASALGAANNANRTANSGHTSNASAAAGEPCRPASWSTATVRDFLHSICIKHVSELKLTGHELIELDANALRRHFGSNPSVDRIRLSVYLQSLQFIDSWWDRGIRPGDIYRKDASESAETSMSKKNKPKRRGSQAGYDSVTTKWGDLSLVLDYVKNEELAETVRARSKVVDGGRAIQTHLLKIANFQVLLEALTPLNRAFGWGCSLESLVRFASIVGGMRGHLWVQDESLPRPQSSHNSSFADLSQLSGGLLEDSSAKLASAQTQDEIGRWVVLQKGSANSTSELTQLVRLCQELRVVMKYTSREDDFIAFIPVSCLRVTSVQEVRAGVFHAALEGLLLDDICVGSKVMVASSDALTRTCERFDWWDRPSAQVLERMSNQVGEVVSLAEAQSKRRVGVRLCGSSSICDALPLEALRLCSEEEYNHLVSTSPAQCGEFSENEVEKTKPVRRKSRMLNGESRKNRLRTLIKTLNQDDAPVVVTGTERRDRPVTPPVIVKPKSAKVNTATRPALEELSNRSELSNLSEDDLTPPPVGNSSSPSKKKKSTAPPVSPQKKLIRRTMVRNDPPTISLEGKVEAAPASFSESETVREIAPNYARSAASSAVVQIRARPESPANESLWSEVEPPAIDYSWLKSVPRSPIDLSLHETSPPIPEVRNQPPSDTAHHNQPPPADSRKHADRKQASGGAPLHIISAGFDADHAEYTTGVPKVRLDSADAQKHERQPNKFLRGNRPQSAPSTGGAKSKRAADENIAGKGPLHSPGPAAEERGGFGLSGMGYVGNGQLQQHPNLWVNENIPVIPEAEVPRVIPHKTPVHHTDYRAGTNKLFEFNKKTLAPEIEHAQGGNHFGSAGDQMAAQYDALSPGRRAAGAAGTATVPQRPRSANPTAGRGVVNPHKTGHKSSLGEALRVGEFPFPAGEEHADGTEQSKKSSKPNEHVKRSREDQLNHIAAAKSAKELSLQEKVLLKELKRLQKTETEK